MKKYLYLRHDVYQGFTIINHLCKYIDGKKDLLIEKRYFDLEDFEKTNTLTDAVFKKLSKARVGTVIDAGSCARNSSYCVKVVDENDPYIQWCQLKEQNEKDMSELNSKIEDFLKKNNLLDEKKKLEKEQRSLSKEFDKSFKLMSKV